MGKIGAGLGTFSMMGKMVSFTPLYNSMASIASSIARAKAEAAKQQKKAEEAAQARIDDFIISDKNQYTQKYLPYAQKSFAELVTNIQDDKINYPNTWMNRVSTRILEAKDKLNWAMEQSTVQRDIEKKAEEGFMVPQELLAAYKQNPGDVSDIATMAPVLNMYGITVSGNGAISHTLSKPVEVGDEFFKFKQSRAVFDEPVTTITAKTSTDGSKFDETRTEKKIAQSSLNNFKVEAATNKDIRTTFKTRRFNEVTAEFDALKKQMQANPSGPQLSDAQLIELATTQAINKSIDRLPISDVTTSQSRQPSGKGITVNVGKPEYVQPKDAFFTEENQVTSYSITPGVAMGKFKPGDFDYDRYDIEITQGGGAYQRTDPDGNIVVYTKGADKIIYKHRANIGTIYGFNAETVYKKQGQAPADVTVAMVRDSKIYHPRSKAPLGSSDKATILKAFNNASITDYYYINGKVFASATVQFKPSENYSIPGINSFLIEVPRNSKLDTIGKNLASSDTKKYASMYDYFKDMAPSGGAAQPQDQSSNRTSGRLNPK